MKLSWRGHGARVENYYALGDAYFAKAKNILLAAAALKILGLPLWVLILSTPVIVVGIAVAGWAWVRWGWFKASQETVITDSWDIKQVFIIHALCRLLEERGLPVNGWQPGEFPPAFTEVLTSMRKP